MSEIEDVFGEVVYSYGFQQAVNDGLFVKVDMAKELGLIETYFTSSLIADITPKEHSNEDLEGRTWDILNMLNWKIRNMGEEEKQDNFLSFEVLIAKKKKTLFAVIQDNGRGKPALTVMLPEDY